MTNNGRKRMMILLVAAMLTCAALTTAAAASGVLTESTFGEIGKDGFYIPLPEGDGWQGGEAWGMRGLFAEAVRTDEQGKTLTMQAYCRELDQFVQNDADAGRYYDSLRFENERNVNIRNVSVGGWNARLVTFSYNRQDGSFAAHGGILLYAREMRLLQIRLYSESQNGREHATPKVTMEDLEAVAERIRFVPEEAPIRHSDVELNIGIEGNTPVVPAGQTLQLTAEFGNESIINSAAGNNGVIWEVLEPETGLTGTAATLNDKGLLTASKNVQWASEVVVRVTSTEYDTFATRKILVTPAATAVTVTPDSLTFYAGENRTETLQAKLEPENVPLIGLNWSASKKDILEIMDNGNGTATVRPMMPGKGTLTVREPGGKTDSVKITVLQPVQAVELTQKGKPRPGNIVNFSAKVTPYNASDRKVEWSTDADEAVAVITSRGRLRISKDAPVGTVIHVTCTAAGAPEPVTATAEVIVVEK